MTSATRILVCVALVFTSTVSSNARYKRGNLANYNGPWQIQNWGGSLSGNENIQLDDGLNDYRSNDQNGQRQPVLSGVVRNIQGNSKSLSALGLAQELQQQDESLNLSGNIESIGQLRGLINKAGLNNGNQGLSQLGGLNGRDQRNNGINQWIQLKNRNNAQLWQGDRSRDSLRNNIREDSNRENGGWAQVGSSDGLRGLQGAAQLWQGGRSRDSLRNNIREDSNRENGGWARQVGSSDGLRGLQGAIGAQEQNRWSQLDQLSDGYNPQLWRNGRSWDESQISRLTNGGSSRPRGVQQNEWSQLGQIGERNNVQSWSGRRGNSGIRGSNQVLSRGELWGRNGWIAERENNGDGGNRQQLENSRSNEQRQQGLEGQRQQSQLQESSSGVNTNQGLGNKYSYGELNAKILKVIQSNPSMMADLGQLTEQLQGDQEPTDPQVRELKRLLQEAGKIEGTSRGSLQNGPQNLVLEKFSQILNGEGIGPLSYQGRWGF